MNPGRATAVIATVILLAASAIAEDARDYRFTEDWFSDNIPNWERVLEPYRGKKDVHYLEVGVFEGRAAGLDAQTESRVLANLKASGFKGKTTTLVGFSEETLRDLPAECCDIIYIDGSHQAAHVLADTVLAWRLLKPGGLLIFDDYQWKRDQPAELRPRTAIDAFISANRGEIEVVLRDYQLIIRKQPNPCGAFSGDCTRFGHYVYFWTKRILRDQRNGFKEVDLDESERRLIEEIALSARHGEVGHFVRVRLARSGAFEDLRKKLDLKLENQIIVPYVAPGR